MKKSKMDTVILFDKRDEIINEDSLNITLEESDEFAAINALKNIVIDVQSQDITYFTST